MLKKIFFFLLTFKKLLVVTVVKCDNFEMLSDSNTYYKKNNMPTWMKSGIFFQTKIIIIFFT